MMLRLLGGETSDE